MNRRTVLRIPFNIARWSCGIIDWSRTAVLLALCFFLGGVARGQEFDGAQLTERTLVFDTTAVQPGKPFHAGIYFTRIAPHWHAYWLYGGEAFSPLKVTWTLPEGWKASEPKWPIPVMGDGNLGPFYGYEKRVLWPVELTPPATMAPDTEAEISVKIEWQVCTDEACVPGRDTFTARLRTGEPAPANTELFQEWFARLPGNKPPFAVAWDTSSADRVVLNLTGVDAGWKLGFFPVPPGNPRAKVVPGVAKEERGDRPENRTLILPIRDKGVPGAVWKGVIVATDATGKQLAWEVDSSVPSSVPSPASTSAEVPRTTVAAQTDALLAVEEESKPFLWIAFLAFLGGIALNFTPCVLPVISLKIFGFVEMAGESKDKVFRYGAAFSAGVIAFFLALAVLAISLRGALNWGAQFQNPYALTPIIAIIFLFGLSMCGVFEFELPGSVMNRLGAWAQGDGLAGTFAHGFTTTLLGASCTAPLLSLPLGYGFSATAHPVAIVAVFALMGVGMTLPYFLLSLRTEWLRYLPKPGAWMKRFKQTLGFVMLAVAVWLLGAVGAIAQVQGLVKVLFFLLSLGIAAWMYGTWFEKPWVLPASALVAVAAWFAFVQGQLRPGQGAPTARAAAQSETWENGITWQPWSRAGVEGAVRDGKVAFVDFTAEWCANCKFIEKTVLNTPEVGAAFKAANVVAFKADWTDENPDITAELKRLGRAAVPVYVVFYPGRPGKILAELPGKAEIIAAVSKP